jgi:hypothetical protein
MDSHGGEQEKRERALYREVNDRIATAARDLGAPDDHELLVFCECGLPGCRELIALTLDEYTGARRSADVYIVVPAHADPDADIELEAAHQYVLVERREPR